MSKNKPSFISRIFSRKTKRQEALGVDDSSLNLPNLTAESENSSTIEVDEQPIKDQIADKADKKKKKEKKALISEPLEFYMGYYAKVTKKDVKDYLFNFATANVTPIDNAFYNIIPYNEGYLWEVHDGGSGRGALTSIIEELDVSNRLTIIKPNYSVAVVKDGDKVSVAKISAANLKHQKENGNIIFKDNMSKFTSSGYGFFIFSLITLAASILLLGASMLNRQDEKNRITNEHLYDGRAKSPMLEINNLNRHMSNEHSGVYVKDMRYVVSTNSWKINTSPTPNYESIKKNVITRLTNKEEALEDVKDKIEDLEKAIEKSESKKSKNDVLNKLAE